ncbi:uncharacterized protein FIBRA_08949 [Fibroporia radiculosa]|uniref:DUF8190 domain-containing protein n=1 Tax=Fibroporia radiculosa TaxID=599839 RepID=J4H5F8_9APHY|nr:uncharacterized protein FIBRA_08949 [Fibroporia radiculosa]CCM06664.1 predicted protein [Fibroporia radiculosa]
MSPHEEHISPEGIDEYNPPAPAASESFSLEGVPSGLSTDDYLDQGEVLKVIYAVAARERDNEDLERVWNNMPSSTVELKELQKMSERNSEKDAAKAMDLLRFKATLNISEDLVYVGEDRQKLEWQAKDHFVDFLMCVSRETGLDACIPNCPTDHTFVMQVDLQQRYRNFKAKHGELGFQSDGRMLYIGTTLSSDVWIAFAPNGALAGDPDSDAPFHAPKKDSRLTSSRSKAFLLFFATLLEEIQYGNIYVKPAFPYGPRNDFEWELREATNVLEHGHINLNVQQLKQISKLFKTWGDWVAAAPNHYRQDPFFRTHSPISVTCRYGQNQPICVPRQSAYEASIWDRERDYSKIRFVSMAIATHLSPREVESYEPIPDQEILRRHGEVFATDDVSPHDEPLDLPNYPLHDDNDRILPIYTQDGLLVPRQRAVFRNQPACAPLLDLSLAPELFNHGPNRRRRRRSPFSEGDNSDDSDVNLQDASIRVQVYPQALLMRYGNLQADSMSPLYDPFISDMERSIRAHIPPPRGDESSSDDDDFYDPDYSDRMDDPRRRHGGTGPIIIPQASQIYNEISHRSRPTAGQQDTCTGELSQAATGAWAKSVADKLSQSRLLERQRYDLPHQRFADKIQHDDCPRALRVENVFTIDLDNMPQDVRNGRFIYNKIVNPMVLATIHPDVAEPILRTTLVFRPKVFPSVYTWTSYPITAALQRQWEYIAPDLEKSQRPNQIAIEILSVLERCLAYAHTGNARVLATKLMTPLLLTRSLLECGLPCLNPSLVQVSSRASPPLRIAENRYPIELETIVMPALASTRACTLTWGREVASLCLLAQSCKSASLCLLAQSC